MCHYNNMSITKFSCCNPVIAVNGSQNSELKLTLNLVKASCNYMELYNKVQIIKCNGILICPVKISGFHL
jgi:hypothetical protein